jgi:hypothetical protein
MFPTLFPYGLSAFESHVEMWVFLEVHLKCPINLGFRYYDI